MDYLSSISRDLFELIIPCLSYVDVVALRWTCSSLLPMPMPCFASRFAKRFFDALQINVSSLPPRPNSNREYEEQKYRVLEETYRGVFCSSERRALKFRIIDELAICGAVVAGSFVLDVLYDTDHHNDIDIYDRTSLSLDHVDRSFYRATLRNGGDNNLKFAQFLRLGEFPRIDNRRPTKTDATREQEDTCRTIYNYSSRELVSSYFSDCNRNSMQLIPVPMDIFRFISASFDLDICKSCFDGKQLRVRSWNKLVERYDYMKYNKSFAMDHYTENCGAKYPELSNRTEKYRQRGFDIRPHPRLEEIQLHIQEAANSGKYRTEQGFQEKIKFIEDGTINLEKFYQE